MWIRNTSWRIIHVRVCEKRVGCRCWCTCLHSSRWWKRTSAAWSPPLHQAQPLKRRITGVQLTWRLCFLLFFEAQHIHTFLSRRCFSMWFMWVPNCSKFKLSEHQARLEHTSLLFVPHVRLYNTLPSLLAGLRLKSIRSKLWASKLRNWGIPNFALIGRREQRLRTSG